MKGYKLLKSLKVGDLYVPFRQKILSDYNIRLILETDDHEIKIFYDGIIQKHILRYQLSNLRVKIL